MSLQSFGFFAFLLAVAAVYLHLPQRWQNPFLLAASWVFYAQAPTGFLLPTAAVALFTYGCGRGIGWRGGAHRAAFVRLGVVGTLGILAFYKYAGGLLGVNAADYTGPLPRILMPLGISFYTRRWDTTWIIWPVAGVLFAALCGVMALIHRNNK